MKRGRYSGSSSDIVGDWSWTGDATADWSDGDKTIDMGIYTLTVNGLSIDGNFKWIGDSIWDCSDDDKTVSIDPAGSFEFRYDNKAMLVFSPANNTITFGNITDNPIIDFPGTGPASFGGILDAASYKVGGVAGVSGTGTTVTAVNGIVTAIS